MLQHLQQLTAPPVFADEAKTRAAALLNTILWAILVAAIFMMCLAPFILPMAGLLEIIALGWVILGLSMLYLLRRGAVQLVSGSFSALAWVLILILAVFSGGIRTAAFSSFMTIIIIAGLLLGVRAGLVLAGLSALAGLGLLYAEMHNRLPPPLIENTPAFVWVFLMINFGVVILVLYLALRSIQEALQQSQHAERALVNAQLQANLGSWEWEIQTGKINWSDEQFHIFGYLPGAVKPTYSLFAAALHPADRERVLAQIGETAKTGLPFEAEYRIVRPDGSMSTVATKAELQRDGQGRPQRVAGTVLDITEHKRVEEALRDTDQRYKLVTEGIGVGIWEFHMHKNDSYLSQKYHELLEYKPGELTGTYEEWMGQVHPDDRARVSNVMQRHLEAREPYDVEYRMQTKSGSYRWFQANGQALWDETGRPILMTGSIADITERKRVEAELRTSETRYRALVESQIDLISRYLPDTKLTFVNDAYCQFYGKTREELIGRSYLTMVAPEFHEQALKETENFVKDPTPIGGEYLNYRWDGQECWIHWILQGIVDDNGQVIEIQASGRDITPLKQAEEEIRRLNAELEQRVIERTAQLEAANKELEAFSYSVSHDLRAPLRAIDGYTRILAEEYQAALDTEGQRVCAVIRHQTQRMGQLIDDLLTFSRLNQAQMQAASIDMTALVTSVFQELTPPEDRERLDFHLAPLPPAVGDPALLRQVWVNLLSNALKFSANRERAVIKVSGKQQADETIYSVQDNGAGFDMQYADKLFGVFQRLHSEREFEGSGVGLAIVQRVIHRHGGRIWAEAEVDQGATFCFTL